MANKDLHYNLIIQGPILSKGRSGKTYLDESITEKSIVNFNCENNLLDILQQYSDYFNQIIIVTWKTENLDEEKFKNFSNCTILKLHDPTPTLINRKGKLPTDFNNKHKQFYSLLNGLEQLEDKNCFVVKIRTDQFLDLDKLIKLHQEELKEKPEDENKLFVPYISIDSYLVGDFYFISKWKILRDFSNSILQFKYLDFNPSVHIDLSLKYSYCYLQDFIKIPLPVYFINSFKTKIYKEKVDLRNYLTQNFYRGLTMDVIKSVFWRGDKISFSQDFFKKNIFKENWKDLIIDSSELKPFKILNIIHSNIPSLIFIKYPFIRNSFLYHTIKKSYELVLRLANKT